MGLCQSQTKKKSLTKSWPTQEQMNQVSRKNLGSLTSLETSQEQVQKTAQKFFDRFNQGKDGVLKKDELINFLRYANKRSGNHRKADIFLEGQLSNLFKVLKIKNRTYLFKNQFVMYIRQTDMNDTP